MHARFDKQGNKLPGTGHGCGCQLCADLQAPRYERRHSERNSAWGPLHRRLARALRSLAPSRPEAA